MTTATPAEQLDALDLFRAYEAAQTAHDHALRAIDRGAISGEEAAQQYATEEAALVALIGSREALVDRLIEQRVTCQAGALVMEVSA